MITLKLTNYSQKEVDLLTEVLYSIQPKLHKHCCPPRPCRECPIRHICMDITQAALYAEEYTAVK